MPVLSQAIQDYLKVTYKIRQREGTVSTSVLAQQMGVSPASATNMVKRLARLLELFLREHLGLSLDQVHDEAEELEHVLSETVESRIAAMLGDPTADPHGDPIPSKAGALAEPEHPRLVDLRPGAGGRIARVSDEDPHLLRRLAVLGLVPGVGVRILQRERHGALALLTDGRRRRISAALARAVFVAPGPD